MRSSSHSLDRISVTFDDDHAVANAGLIQPATLAERLGLRELFDEYVDLGDAPGRANVGLKAMTLIYSAARRWRLHRRRRPDAGGGHGRGARPGRASSVDARDLLAHRSPGDMSPSSTGCSTSRSDRDGLSAPGPARGRSPSMWIPRSVRPMGFKSKVLVSATPMCGAFIRCSPPWPAAKRWSVSACGAATPTPAGGQEAFSPRCSTACAGPLRPGR